MKYLKERIKTMPQYSLMSMAVLGIALVHPPHGSGIEICLFKRLSALPCPGCGLTRSFSCATHGMLTESWLYHPFGLILVTACIGMAIMGFLTDQGRPRTVAGGFVSSACGGRDVDPVRR